ncbi:MAG: protein kinase [Xenococcaceae cyanobacterium]
MLGQLLDRRYRIIETLGAGGFGKTYIAEDTKLPGNPRCVVKQLKPIATDPTTLQIARRLFDSEAQVLQQLGKHDQIPQLLAYFEENQEFYLVQEFIDGHLLSQELTHGKQLSESYAIALLQGILEPLTFVHQQNVIHRDIKPANLIRRQQDGKIVLIDFGAVKQIAVTQVVNAQGLTRLTVTIGTPGYMPSEQSKGSPRLSSDIYAVGIIGIQALTGVMPEELTEDPDTAEIIWRNQVQVNPMLADVLDQMVRYDFRQRYRSAVEALQGLQQLRNGDVSRQSQPSYTPIVPTTVINNATTSMHELTLEWVEAGQVKTQAILESQPSKNPETFRIGRDPALCDLVLLEPTVSRLHVEIFFNSQQQHFYLRSLNQNNPPVVNGRSLPRGEVALNQGSNLQLGQIELRVTAIVFKQYQGEYAPTGPSLPSTSTPQQPVALTQTPQQPNTSEKLLYPPPPVPPQFRQEIPDLTELSQPSSGREQAKRPQVGWGFLLKWVLANAVGCAVFIAVGNAVGDAVSDALGYNVVGFAVICALGGPAVGIMQWVVLRQVVGRAWWWVLATAVGEVVGGAVGYAAIDRLGYYKLLGYTLFGVLGGSVVGIMQWVILRRVVNRAWWWVLANAVGVGVGFTAIKAILNVWYNEFVSLAAGVVIALAITGSVLVLLLQHPVLQE